MQPDRLRVLDSLRGAAALIVVWHHVWKVIPVVPAWLATDWPGLVRVATWLSDQNVNAVLFFFVLSGFSIRLALDKSDFFQPHGMSMYLRMRAARILPPYWLALVWTAFLGWLSGADHASFGVQTLLGNVAFLQTSSSARGAWFEPYGLNGPLWSLSYEVFYYLAVAALLALVGRTRAAHDMFAPAFLAGTTVVSLMAIAVGLVLPNPFFSFAALWAVWAYGYAAAEIFIHGRPHLVFFAPTVLIGSVFFAARSAGLFSATLELLVAGALIGTTAVVVASIARRPASRPRIAFVNAVNAILNRVGRGSYALYLLHYPLLLAVAVPLDRLGPQLGSTMVAALVTVMAVIVCPWLESILRTPARRLVGLANAAQTHKCGA